MPSRIWGMSRDHLDGFRDPSGRYTRPPPGPALPRQRQRLPPATLHPRTAQGFYETSFDSERHKKRRSRLHELPSDQSEGPPSFHRRGRGPARRACGGAPPCRSPADDSNPCYFSLPWSWLPPSHHSLAFWNILSQGETVRLRFHSSGIQPHCHVRNVRSG